MFKRRKTSSSGGHLLLPISPAGKDEDPMCCAPSAASTALGRERVAFATLSSVPDPTTAVPCLPPSSQEDGALSRLSV